MPEGFQDPTRLPLDQRLARIRLRAANRNIALGAIDLDSAAEIAQPMIISYMASLCVARRNQIGAPPLRIGESISIGELPPVLPALYFITK